MRSKIIISVLLLVFCINHKNYCQSDLSNHKKYWYYKSRLNNDFIKIGNTTTSALLDVGHGESIPFNERNLDFTNYGPITPSQYNDNHRILKHGDESARLGIYLAVLATEYRLLKNNNQTDAVSRVKHEIFCALNAINRIDYHAEQALSPPQNPNLNGFFIRSDIPQHFVLDNYNHFNYYHNIASQTDSTQDKGFTSTINNPVTRSEDSPTDNGYIQDPSEESQDQVYYLLMGLTLTNKLVDGNETDGANTFGYGSGETLLSIEAAKIAGRLIKHIKNDPLWTIRNPNTNNPVGVGAPAFAYSYPMDNLGCFLEFNQDFPFWFLPYITQPTAYPHNSCWDYRNAYSFSPASTFLWQDLAASGGGPTADMQGFFHALAGTSNSVFQPKTLLDLNVQATIVALQNQINNAINAANEQIQNIIDNLPNWVPEWLQNATQAAITLITQGLQFLINNLQAAILTAQQYLNPSVLINTTDDRLLYNTVSNQVIYYNNCLFPAPPGPDVPLVHLGSDLYFGTYLRDILHGYNFNLPNNLQWINNIGAPGHLIIKNDVENILGSAPCEGNYNQFPTAPSGNQWGVSCFVDRPDHLWKKATCSGNLGEYSGTDYMLLHNLYYLTEGTNQPLIDFINRTVPTNYPNGNLFTLTNKLTFGSFEYIKATNTISANGAAIYRTGKEIALLPGFSAAQGCDFDAIISPYSNCAYSGNMNKNTNVLNDDFAGGETGYIQNPIKPSDPTNDNSLEDFSNQIQNNLNTQMDSINKEYSKILATIKNYNKVSIYPNPNTGKFVVQFNLTNEDNISLQITDILGRVVLDEKYVTGSYTLPVDLSFFAKGVYMAKIKHSEGKEETRKITIQ